MVGGKQHQWEVKKTQIAAANLQCTFLMAINIRSVTVYGNNALWSGWGVHHYTALPSSVCALLLAGFLLSSHCMDNYYSYRLMIKDKVIVLL